MCKQSSKDSYHSAFSWHGAVIKKETDIRYMNEYPFSQTPGVSTLSEITLFPFLGFLTKYYPSHLVKRHSDVYNKIILLCKQSV